VKVMIISDLHYDKRIYKGVDESRAWSWLMSVVDYHRPDLLISLGDWGEAVNESDFGELLRRVRVWSIYGNHDILGVLGKMFNIVGGKLEPVLFEDGEVREIGGLRFGAINGIIALRRREKGGVPRKRPEEYIEIGKRLRDRVDVLLIHDSPKLPLKEYEFMRNDAATQAVEVAIYEAKPRIVLCGHIHIENPYTVYRYEYGTLYIRIDSSQRHRAYLVMHTGNGVKLEIWRDTDLVYEGDIDV